MEETDYLRQRRERKEENYRRWNDYEEKRCKELLDTDEYRELQRKAFPKDYGSDDIDGAFEAWEEMQSMQDEAWTKAHNEAEQTQAYKEWLETELIEENARESALPFIRDYQNGHYTYFDKNGDVIGEDIA